MPLTHAELQRCVRLVRVQVQLAIANLIGALDIVVQVGELWCSGINTKRSYFSGWAPQYIGHASWVLMQQFTHRLEDQTYFELDGSYGPI
jgi:hypothetical protein